MPVYTHSQLLAFGFQPATESVPLAAHLFQLCRHGTELVTLATGDFQLRLAGVISHSPPCWYRSLFGTCQRSAVRTGSGVSRTINGISYITAYSGSPLMRSQSSSFSDATGRPASKQA